MIRIKYLDQKITLDCWLGPSSWGQAAVLDSAERTFDAAS